MALYTFRSYRPRSEILGASLLFVASLVLGGMDFGHAEAAARPTAGPLQPGIAGAGPSASPYRENPRIRYPYGAPADSAFGDVATRHTALSGGGEGASPDGDTRFAAEITGAPYEALGIWYAPTAEPEYDETGKASFYGPGFHGKPTASGEIFDSTGITAAHPTLPIPSLVQVTNLANGRELVVRVNYRVPFAGGRIIDLSTGAAEILGFQDKGIADVRVRYLGPAPTRLVTPEIGRERSPARPDSVKPGAKPVTAPAIAVPEAPENPGPRWRLQVASFNDLTNARDYGREVARKLGDDWGRIEYEAAMVNGIDVFRVLVGTWAERDSAVAARVTANQLLGVASVVIHRPS